MMLSEIDIVARTVYGEARGETMDGKQAVAHVILNRAAARHRGEVSPAGVALEPAQFSCWNSDDPNYFQCRTVRYADPVFRDCLIAVLLAMRERVKDPTFGAEYYHTLRITPRWAKGKTPIVKIGNHYFYTKQEIDG